jgi:hypothetical protein
MIRTTLLFTLLSWASYAEETPRFMPENTGAEAHPIVAAVKIVGMIATAAFVIVMVVKSVRSIKNEEDDRVELPD